MTEDDVMELYTCQMANWRKARDLGIAVLDVTFKSGDKRFAPDADLLYRYKDGTVSDEQYTERYIELMDTRYAEDPGMLSVITEHESLCLMCYCAPGQFCHRHLLTKWLAQHIKVSYRGEIRKTGLEALVYPSFPDQLIKRRIGLYWDEVPVCGNNLLSALQKQNPDIEWVVLGVPDKFLSYAHRNHWLTRRFDPEDAHDFYVYCTEMIVFTKNKGYRAPISWTKQHKPFKVNLINDPQRSRN